MNILFLQRNWQWFKISIKYEGVIFKWHFLRFEICTYMNMNPVKISFSQCHIAVLFSSISCEKVTISRIFNFIPRAGTFLKVWYALVIHMVLKMMKNVKNSICARWNVYQSKRGLWSNLIFTSFPVGNRDREKKLTTFFRCQFWRILKGIYEYDIFRKRFVFSRVYVLSQGGEPPCLKG